MCKEKIIYIGGFELPDKNAAAQRVIANGKAIEEMGYQLIYIGISKSATVNNFKRENYFGNDVFSKKYPDSTMEWFEHYIEFDYYRKIIKKYRNVKAIICYNLSSLSLFRLKCWAQKNRILIIADCTEWYEVSSGEGLIKKIIKSLDIYFRMNIIHNKLDGVITISNFLENFYKNKGVKTINIPPLVDIRDSKWNDNKKNGAYQDKIEIIYAGSPFSMETKGQKDRLDQIVEFFNGYGPKNNVRLNIIGIDKETFEKFYNVFELKLDDNFIKFHGRLSHLSVIKKLKISDFFIFLREDTLTNRAGFPTKFVEALTSGIPVLTNKSSNISDYLVDGVNGFWLDNSSYSTLKETLERALKISIEDLNIMKANIRNSRPFDYRKFITQFEEILGNNKVFE